MTGNSSDTANQLVAFFDETAKKQSKSVGVELLPISRSHGFLLPGPAVVNVVYVRHPVNELELIPFADYDEKLARDRYEEALRVFTKLGAARIVAKSQSQTTKKGSVKIAGTSFNMGIRSARADAWSLAADLEGEGAPPHDPRPLQFQDIAGLDSLCEGVLNNGWRKGNIHITQSSTLGVDGELAGVLRKAGFTLGLSGGKSKVTEFVIEAAFTPEAAKALDVTVAATKLTDSEHSWARRQVARVLSSE